MPCYKIFYCFFSLVLVVLTTILGLRLCVLCCNFGNNIVDIHIVYTIHRASYDIIRSKISHGSRAVQWQFSKSFSFLVLLLLLWLLYIWRKKYTVLHWKCTMPPNRNKHHDLQILDDILNTYVLIIMLVICISERHHGLTTPQWKRQNKTDIKRQKICPYKSFRIYTMAKMSLTRLSTLNFKNK